MSSFHVIEKLHQILIVDGFGIPAEIPDLFVTNTEYMKYMHAEADYHLWSGEELRDYIKNNFELDVLETFDKLKPYSYKCDLGRFCVIYMQGGIYADLGMRFARSFTPPVHAGFSAFRSLSFLTDSWLTMSTGVFWAQPRRKELEFAIRNIISNVKDGFYGTNPLCPTGPVLFGRSIARAAVENNQNNTESDQWIGEVKRIDPKSLSTCHVTPDGEVTVMNIKSGKSLKDLGLLGSNTYYEMWQNRDIYE